MKMPLISLIISISPFHFVLFGYIEYIWIDNIWRKQTKRKNTCMTAPKLHIKEGLNVIALLFPFLSKTNKTKQHQQTAASIGIKHSVLHLAILCSFICLAGSKLQVLHWPPSFLFRKDSETGSIYQLYHSFIC